MKARPGFIELPVDDIVVARDFYRRAFGWSLTDFGPTYACTTTGDVDIGLQGDPAEATTAPLAVISVDDLDVALAQVTAAGATIVRPTFSFPGGRRFQFRDPAGNELAVMQAG